MVLAAVSAAGYVLVLRPSKTEAAALEIPPTITRNQRELPATQAAFVDAFQVLGESLPLPGNREDLRRQLVMAGYRWNSVVSIFLGIKAASAIMFGVAVAWAAVVKEADPFAVVLAMVCGLGFGYLVPDRVLDRLGAARVAKLRRALPSALDLLVLAVEAAQRGRM